MVDQLGRRTRLSRRELLAGSATVAGGGALAFAYASRRPHRRTDRRPNVLWIITDDMSVRELPHMPRTWQLVTRHGTRFANGYAAVPWCGPARASILTSLYSHNHACLTNHTHPDFIAQGLDQDTVGTRMHAAGYATGYFGKYMNSHEVDPSYVPPGWDRVVALFGRASGVIPVAYDGRLRKVHTRYGSGDQIVAKELQTFIARHARHPFFAVFAPTNPHGPHNPSRKHRHTYDGIRWDPASLNEADLTDKPTWMRDLPVLNAEAMRRQWEGKLEELQDTADQVSAILATLERHDLRRDTYIMLVSDNGYLLGQHRLFAKTYPYEEATRIPFAIIGPDVRRARTHVLASQVDLMPTTLAVAGLDPDAGRTLDGRNLLPHLRTGAWEGWRQRVLFENLDLGWAALREADDAYINHYARGEQELYDLASDPHQMRNKLARSPEGTPSWDRAAELAAVLEQLLAARGTELRMIET